MKVLLTDIGGVLLTNGWDGASRKKAAAHFQLDYAEMDERHRLTYDTYEAGKISLHVYLQQIIFYQPRDFTEADFYAFMQTVSQPYQEMIALYRELKTKYNLRIGAVSNEGRDLGGYRVKQFHLDQFIDFFVISGFVGLRKPDPAIFQLALDIAQAPISDILYIDDRPILVDIATSYDIPSFRHQNLEETRSRIETFAGQNS